LGESQEWVEKLISSYVERLNQHIRVSRVLVFGSRARGDFEDSSDLDLLIISPDFEGMYLEDRCKLLLKCWGRENYLKLRINAYGYTPKEFNKAKSCDPLVRKALRDGVVTLKAKGDGECHT